MNKLILIVAACAIVSGCAVTKAEWGGDEIVRDLKGAPIIARDGTVQKVTKPTRLFSNRHWFDSHINQAALKVEDRKIDFNLNGYNGEISTNFVAWTDVMLKGAATLATKVGSAIATAGGTAAADPVFGLVSRFIQAGGNASKATITAADGNVTVTDGTITCTGDECFLCRDGACSPIQQ